MTVLAAAVINGTMALAGDRAASEDGTILVLSKPKVARRGEYLVGYYGSLEGERLLELFKFPDPPKDPELLDHFMYTTLLRDLEKFYDEQRFDLDDTDNGLGLIILVGGKIYDHAICDGTMVRYERDYIAVGSGGSFALGALSHPWKNAKTAVEHAVGVACDFSTTCTRPIDVVTKSVRKKRATKPKLDRTVD